MKQDYESQPPVYSFWPLLLAIGVLLIAIGIASVIWVSIFGAALLFASIMGWVWENRLSPEEEQDD
jgi:hypothetical protein